MSMALNISTNYFRWMNGYQHSRNKVYLIQYHLVWCPKRRKPVLVGKIKEMLEQKLSMKLLMS